MAKPVRTKPAPGAIDPKTTEFPFSMKMGSGSREKLQRMLAFCLMNGLEANSGVILRTLLQHAPERSAEFLGQVRDRMAEEKDLARERRRQP